MKTEGHTLSLLAGNLNHEKNPTRLTYFGQIKVVLKLQIFCSGDGRLARTRRSAQHNMRAGAADHCGARHGEWPAASNGNKVEWIEKKGGADVVVVT